MAATDVDAAELELACQVIGGLTGEFDPDELRCEYRDDLRALLEAKLRGEDIVQAESGPASPVVDLTAALRASIAEAQSQRDTKRAQKTPRALT